MHGYSTNNNSKIYSLTGGVFPSGGALGNVVMDYTSPTWNLNSFSFDGTDNKFAGDATASTIINNAIVGASKQFTMSFWAKRGASGVTQLLFLRDNSSTATRQFLVFYGNDDKFRAQFFTNSTNHIVWISTATFTELREWNQWTVVYDGTQSATGRISVYRNGRAEAGATTQTGTFTTINNTSANNIEIGGRAAAASFSNVKVSQLSVFNTNLSATNVSLLHNTRVPFDVRTNSTLNANLVMFLCADYSATFSTNWAWTDLVGGAVFTSAGMVSGDRVGDAPALKQISVVRMNGQSNCPGRENMSRLDVALRGPLPWHQVWDPVGTDWDDIDSTINNNSYKESFSQYGAIFYLGNLLNRHFRKTIYTAMLGQGGSSIAYEGNTNNWHVPDATQPAGGGRWQDVFNTEIPAIKEWELANGYTITKICQLWIQGEADSQVEAEANAYEANLTATMTHATNGILTRLTNLFYVEPYYYDFLLSANQTDPVMAYKSTINTAKENFRAASPARRRTINMDTAPVSADNIHYGDAGYLVMAQLGAQAIIDDNAL